jgi:hypothetical protein
MKIMFRNCKTITFLFFMSSTPVFAQSNDSMSFFQSVNSANPAPTPEYVKDAIEIKFSLGTSGLPASCQPGSAIAVTDIKPDTADRALWKAARAGQIMNAWTAKVRLGGCGKEPANYLVVKDKTGRTSVGVFSWGESLAGISLSRDAMPAALGAMAANMKKIAPDCTIDDIKKFTIGPREILDMKDAGDNVYGVRFKGNWSEIWHFKVCGYDVAIPMKFRADGSGGAYYEAGTGVTSNKL